MNQPANSLCFADGTVLENSSCGGSDHFLWCWISGKSMAECVSLFSDSEKTREIVAAYVTERIIYRGYTDLLVVEKANDPMTGTDIRVRLTWPEGGEHSIITEPITGDDESE